MTPTPTTQTQCKLISDHPYYGYLFGCRQRTEEAFDCANQDEIAEAMRSIGSILSMQVILSLKGGAILDRRFEAFALLKGALDMLVSALHLARQRAPIATACLLRSALESGCTAIHISTDENAYRNFINQTYHSTKSISGAKRHIAIVGELWGALSEYAVHINVGAHGPRCRRSETPDEAIREVELNFQEIKADPLQDSFMLALIKLTATIITQAFELSLLDDDASQPGWRTVSDASLIYCSDTRNAIDREWKRIISLAASRNSLD